MKTFNDYLEMAKTTNAKKAWEFWAAEKGDAAWGQLASTINFDITIERKGIDPKKTTFLVYGILQKKPAKAWQDVIEFKTAEEAFSAAEKATGSPIPQGLQNKFLFNNTYYPSSEFYDDTREDYDRKKAQPLRDKNRR